MQCLMVKMFDVEGTRGMRMAGTRCQGSLEARILSKGILAMKEWRPCAATNPFVLLALFRLVDF